ncbi:hypothetical protein [Bosea sp. BH3]|uniref:hypothetical protein n=1 Tax=Bosea sp. BH3 TaxID=2871701 RepID=UPI0021CB2C75|nr:hypothetical protein [Bosea sp. BH3]MCU4181138.1 hypothetical protein [Bosea sp. BH3]
MQAFCDGAAVRMRVLLRRERRALLPLWAMLMKLRFHRGARLIAVGAIAALVPASPVSAACNVFAFAAAQPLVERFVFRPETLFAEYRDGGPAMINRVLIIAASSRAALQPLSRQVQRGSQRQREAIAAGLAIAAKMCAPKSRDHAHAIEQVARNVTDAAFQKEFRSRYSSAIPDNDLKTRERALTEALVGEPKLDDAQRNTMFSPGDTRPVQPLGAIAPIPSTIPPIR